MSVLRFGSLIAAALIAGCSARDTASNSLALTDALGRRVALDHPASRIVSLSPATTELLFELGAGDRVVGRTRWCDYPPEVLSLPSVGDGLNPNVEAVAAQRPDLVVMYSTPANAGAIEKLAGLGIPSVNLPMDRLADVSVSARMLGRLIGDSANAERIAARFDSSLAALRAEQPLNGPSIALLAWDNPPIVIGAGSFLNELVDLAGGHNVFADIPKPSGNVNIETIAARNPSFILLEVSDTASEPRWTGRPEWQVVPAVRSRRFGVMRGSLFGRPSLRAPQAVEELRVMFRTDRK